MMNSKDISRRIKVQDGKTMNSTLILVAFYYFHMLPLPYSTLEVPLNTEMIRNVTIHLSDSKNYGFHTDSSFFQLHSFHPYRNWEGYYLTQQSKKTMDSTIMSVFLLFL